MINLSLLIHLLPVIISLMGTAEKAMTKGADKKALVMESTKAIITGLQTVSTGGQKETWDRIAIPVSDIIDNISTIVFPKHYNTSKSS